MIHKLHKKTFRINRFEHFIKGVEWSFMSRWNLSKLLVNTTYFNVDETVVGQEMYRQHLQNRVKFLLPKKLK